MKLKADDGSFLFTGAKNTVYYVMISTYDVPVWYSCTGSPGVCSREPAYRGNPELETVDGTADGKSVNFSTGGGASSISTVNFWDKRGAYGKTISLFRGWRVTQYFISLGRL